MTVDAVAVADVALVLGAAALDNKAFAAHSVEAKTYCHQRI